MKKASQLVLWLGLVVLTGGRSLATETNFQSGLDFPWYNYQVEQPLVGQQNWQSALNYSSNAAQIVSYAAGQALEIFGPFVASNSPNSYNSEFIQPLSNYDAVASGTPIVSVTADMWMNLGPTASAATYLYGFLVLNDENGNAYETIGVDKNGVVFGQNFATPNQVVTATNPGTNTFHILRADLNFTNRQITFYMDATPFGSMPFNPASGHLLGSVGLILQGSNPLDSILLVDNVGVTAGKGTPGGTCTLQITSAGPCLADGTPGTPNVGDIYGLRVNFNDIGAASPFRIKFTIGNVTWYSGYFTGITTGSGYWSYFDWYVNLDGPLPWNVVIDPDGVSGSTNTANMIASGTFTPAPPSVPLELYDPAIVGGVETSKADFQPGSGTISDLWIIFGSPTSHGAQNMRSVTVPSNSTTIVTAPYSVPVFVVGRTNVPTAVYEQSESFTAQLSAMRVNPALLRTNTWAQMSALPANITEWLAPDPICQSTSSAISNLVQLYLPANYQSVLTPYDTARVLHKAVARSLVYLTPAPYPDATNSLRVGQGDCGSFAAILTACLRQVGIPARRISGFWEGDCWQNNAQWHVRTEYYLPNTGWLITDSCEGNQSDPTGSFSWDFSFAPDANEFFAIDVGDQHILSFNNFNALQVPNLWWHGSGTLNFYDSLSYLQPLATLSASESAGAMLDVTLTNVPNEGTVFIEASSNLTAWLAIATNLNPSESLLDYSFPETNRPGMFFRARQIP